MKKTWFALLAVPALVATASAQTETAIDAAQFKREAIARLERVREFRLAAQTAQKLGLRAWLFGGTAASYAHYVKWDLEREAGDRTLQGERFDYDYTNIFRSTQDLDIVVDGEGPDLAERAAKLQAVLAREAPHLQGSRNIWEVRLLRGDLGSGAAKKDSLLGWDFQNQNTDSNSTGMIELTTPPAGEPAIRDARAWNNPRPPFLEDTLQGTLHYYSSEHHAATQRAKDGLNPEIFSVVRYLTKAFQYHLRIPQEDWDRIQRIIRDFRPERDLTTSYSKDWLEKNGKKLIQHSVDIEYSVDTLDRLGLREKLIKLGAPQSEGTLAWWMQREPLRTSKVGRGSGATAASLKITEVSHETADLPAFESITRAHSGSPNVLISRANAPQESAVFGDGFYTAVGHEGARGTGLTIRFRVDPKAREGTDFKIVEDTNVKDGTYVIWLNRAALRVIPESLDFEPVQYFETLASGRAAASTSDRGLLEKFQRRIAHQLSALSHSQDPKDLVLLARLRAIADRVATSSRSSSDLVFWAAWLGTPFGDDQIPTLKKLIESRFLYGSGQIQDESRFKELRKIYDQLGPNAKASLAGQLERWLKAGLKNDAALPPQEAYSLIALCSVVTQGADPGVAVPALERAIDSAGAPTNIAAAWTRMELFMRYPSLVDASRPGGTERLLGTVRAMGDLILSRNDWNGFNKGDQGKRGFDLLEAHPREFLELVKQVQQLSASLPQDGHTPGDWLEPITKRVQSESRSRCTGCTFPLPRELYEAAIATIPEGAGSGNGLWTSIFGELYDGDLNLQKFLKKAFTDPSTPMEALKILVGMSRRLKSAQDEAALLRLAIRRLPAAGSGLSIALLKGISGWRSNGTRLTPEKIEIMTKFARNVGDDFFDALKAGAYIHSSRTPDHSVREMMTASGYYPPWDAAEEALYRALETRDPKRREKILDKQFGAKTGKSAAHCVASQLGAL